MQRTATRLRAPVGELSKQHLVRVILVGLLLLVAIGTAVGAAWAHEVQSPFPVGETAMGTFFFAVVLLLLVINRLGHWQLATWGTVACLVLGGSVFFDLASLDPVFIVMAVPVVLAAFLIRPGAAFEVAALAAGIYVMSWLREGPTPAFNYFSLLALAGVALVAWLVARRVEWLEEAEDMSRRELDRLADERDVLKGQVRALADEIARVRDEAASRGRGAARR